MSPAASSDQIKIRVDASTPGSPPKQLSPNASEPTRIQSAAFEGDVLVRIKDFVGESADGAPKHAPADGYFSDDGPRKGKTWSIFVRGRFLEEVNADDILFGNTFERPIKDHLPWGTAVALKFLRLIDPNLEQDLYAEKPWALSPLLSTIPYLAVTPLAQPSLPPWSASDLEPLEEQTVDAFIGALAKTPEKAAELEDLKGQGAWDTARRRAWLTSAENRKAVYLGPGDLLEMDFAQGYIDFNDLSVGIPSVGFHIKLKDYWDGQPLTFTCRNRSGSKTFFSVVFQITGAEPVVDGAVVVPTGADAQAAAAAKEADDNGDGEEISDEVD